jgi:hypothetical protein
MTAALGSSVAAQDANYWSLQYGPVAQLAGGQVVASTRDLSATFYNPGALAFPSTGGFLLSTESFQYENVSGEPRVDGLEVLNLSSSQFGSAPSLLAGNLPKRWLGEKTHLAWSFLTRQQLKTRLGERIIDPFPVPDSESVSESYFDQDVTEHWAGLSAAYPLSESVGIGGTLYGVWRSQRSRAELSAQLVTDAGAGLSAGGVEEFNYYHARLLGKLGIAYEKNRLKLGLSITTPGVGVFGSGKIGFSRSASGIDADGNGLPDPPFLERGQAEDLPTDYRSSWAIGAGASWSFGSTQIHLSAEWFAPVDRFTVLQVDADDGGVESLTQELASVLNAGAAYEHNFSEKFAIYGALRTDFSAAVGDPSVIASISNWDIYHASAGMSFDVGGNRFTLGADASFGSEDRGIPVLVPPEQLPELGLTEGFDVRYRRIVFLLGFVFGS